ncbi:glycosyltransferase family 2 protein [Herbaspirillum sp. LeCh32-8]|uniref:glycosyltransferase family 2 protein n=1 Tax=Herbaspirillum sp. LeCh32-8 TaxID=2821356 RepID=UPI001AE991EA|nr:glycosyltransferase family 2 protein [Herbaspirillum sp. LeCh32-8]MBP0598385.1 glycosyltransferase family 2 protein [Herbaspirillum sp. LeCh32-8]
MQDKGLVSVIIPTWNRERDLAHAIRSALTQTYRNLEVLVCDDGSTDTSRDLVEQIGDARVRWIEGAHAGLPSVPRNRGMRAARGEWIAFMDSDDTWLEDKLARQLVRMSAAGGMPRASCGNALRRIGPESPAPDAPLLLAQTEDTELPLSDLMQSNSVVTSTVVLHRSLLPAIGEFPTSRGLKVGEDYAYWLRAASLTPFAFHGAALASYADIPAASVRASVRNETLAKLRVYRDYFGWLSVSYPHRLATVLPLCLFLESRNALLRRWWRLRNRLGLLRRRLFPQGRQR